MIDKVRDKFNAEQGKTGNDITRIIWDRLQRNLHKLSDEELNGLLDKKITLAGAVDKMIAEAKQHKVGTCAVLSDAHGFRICDEYMGITSDLDMPSAPPAPPIVKVQTAAVPSAPPKPSKPVKKIVSLF